MNKMHKEKNHDATIVKLMNNVGRGDVIHLRDDAMEHVRLHRDKGSYDDLPTERLERFGNRCQVVWIFFFGELNAYNKVPKSEAKRLGVKAITARRVDVSKGDNGNPDDISRVVGRGTERGQRFDLIAAAPPPPEALRMIARVSASYQGQIDTYRGVISDIEGGILFCNGKRDHIH